MSASSESTNLSLVLSYAKKKSSLTQLLQAGNGGVLREATALFYLFLAGVPLAKSSKPSCHNVLNRQQNGRFVFIVVLSCAPSGVEPTKALPSASVAGPSWY